MNFSSPEILNRLQRLEEENRLIRENLNKVKGVPVIQGYAGKKLDLNDNLNVILLLKRISDLESSVTYLQNYSVNSLENYLYDGIVVPASNTTSGTKDQIAYDANYLYVCRATDRWERIAWDTLWEEDITILDEAGNDFLAEDGIPLSAE